VRAEVIGRVLADAEHPAAPVDQLIDAALAAGGRDHITVIVAEAQPAPAV
jgi:serine/threonine protein phosphatase PrpC